MTGGGSKLIGPTFVVQLRASCSPQSELGVGRADEAGIPARPAFFKKIADLAAASAAGSGGADTANCATFASPVRSLD